MIRAIFWLALLANLLFFAYMEWGAALLHGNAELLAQPPLNPDKIKLVVPAPAAASIPAAASVASAPQPVTPPPVAAAAPAAPPVACMEWGEFSGDDLREASAALATLKLSHLSQREVEHSIGFWVYIPPQHNRAEAEKKVSQLKTLGIADYFIVQDAGKWHNAISLGVFKTQDAAHKYLAGLQQKGVRSAVIGERQSQSKFVVFVFRNPDSATTAKVVALQKDFPDSELKAAACN